MVNQMGSQVLYWAQSIHTGTQQGIQCAPKQLWYSSVRCSFAFFTFHTPDLFSESWASPFKYADDAGIGHRIGIHKAFPL